MSTFLTALALAICLEGLLYAAFPEQMKKALAVILSQPGSTIRATGLACAAVGLVLLWLLRA